MAKRNYGHLARDSREHAVSLLRRGWHTPLRLDFAVSADTYGSVVGALFGSVATIG